MSNFLFIAGIILALAITALWIALFAFELFRLLAPLVLRHWNPGRGRRRRAANGCGTRAPLKLW